jgi:hypothetical protein
MFSSEAVMPRPGDRAMKTVAGPDRFREALS